MVPKATVKVFRDILEKHSRDYLEIFNGPWEKRRYDAMFVLLRDEPEIYVHSFFREEGEILPYLRKEFESLERLWGVERKVDLYVLMSEIWQEHYVSRAREDLLGRTGEERIPAKTLRVFEKALNSLLWDYPAAAQSINLLHADPELCVHALFVAMRQKQINDGVKWYELIDAAHPQEVEKARQDLLEEVSV